MDTKVFLRALSPKMVSKATQAFDRATTVVVISCWCAAAVAIFAAVYTVTLTISARHATEEALIAEPVLPKIGHKPMDMHTVQVVFDRMQHRFPDVAFSVKGQNLGVAETSGAKFHQWLTALSYVDTISPEFHWSIDELCVGNCGTSELMHAVLKGDHISFETPQPDSK